MFLKGTILRPLLFNIYVNRMKETITKNYDLLQNADDTMIISANTNEKTLTILRKHQNILKGVFEIHLTINAGKTDFMFCKILIIHLYYTNDIKI